jgi:hypothetical protein
MVAQVQVLIADTEHSHPVASTLSKARTDTGSFNKFFGRMLLEITMSKHRPQIHTSLIAVIWLLLI